MDQHKTTKGTVMTEGAANVPHIERGSDLVRVPESDNGRTIPLLMFNRDSSEYLRVESDGTVAGELAEKYPDAKDAFAELAIRLKDQLVGDGTGEEVASAPVSVDGFTIYPVQDAGETKHVIAWGGQWLSGAYPDVETALEAGKHQVGWKGVVQRMEIRHERMEGAMVYATLVLWSDGTVTWENLQHSQF